MKLMEILGNVRLEKMPNGKPSAMYWHDVFTSQQPEEDWDASHAEISAAILDSSPNKFLALAGDKIVGAVAFSSDDKSVHVEHVGSIMTSVGTTLMNRVHQFASRKKLPVTLVPSRSAESFYKKLGYVPSNQGDLWIKQLVK